MDLKWLWEMATSLWCFEFFACLLTLNYVVHTINTKCVLFQATPPKKCTVEIWYIVLLSRDKKFPLPYTCTPSYFRHPAPLFVVKVFLLLTSKFVGHNKRKVMAEEKLIGHSVAAKCVMKSAGNFGANNEGNIIKLLGSCMHAKFDRL